MSLLSKPLVSKEISLLTSGLDSKDTFLHCDVVISNFPHAPNNILQNFREINFLTKYFSTMNWFHEKKNLELKWESNPQITQLHWFFS